MNRIDFAEMHLTIKKAFLLAGMPEDKADICARIHTESSRDGVYSHGLNRVERFVNYIHKGWVDVHAGSCQVAGMGNFEIYDGNLGPGILNAMAAMDRATVLALEKGFGLVSLRNTTHWMRGGTYGWQAADKGVVAICWTNTESCMPPWGASTVGIGNNPFVMAVPGKDGNHMVLDMAMSLYSYGKLKVTRLRNERLPYPGGYDHEGKLTDIPGPIEESMRILPTGFWKGSGMAVLLDVVSALLSGGLVTADIDKTGKGSCGRCNQIFMAFDPLKINSTEYVAHVMEETVKQLKSLELASGFQEILYPGERTIRTRKENLTLGIPVDDNVWTKVRQLAGIQ